MYNLRRKIVTCIKLYCICSYLENNHLLLRSLGTSRQRQNTPTKYKWSDKVHRMILKVLPAERTIIVRSNTIWAWMKKDKPLASEVLTSYLLQTNEPPWTSYFVKYADVVDNQRGMSHFNWPVGSSNYHVLRTGCFPYIKYHCTKRPRQDLTIEDKLFKAIKLANLGIPLLMYGLAAALLIRHREAVKTAQGDVTIYFLLPEDVGSMY